MAIPELDSQGFLPGGIHDCTLDEMEERFGQFQFTGRRHRLFRSLHEFVNEARAAGLADAMIVNGSFVTARDEPNDIDLILVLKPDHDFDATLRPFQYNLISRRRVLRNYGFDLLAATEGSTELQKYVEFFSQVRGLPGREKGLLRVRL